MDGSRFKLSTLILLLFFFLTSGVSTSVNAADDPCEWSCGQISKKDKDFQAIKEQSAQVQNFLQNTSTCALPSSFEQNLALGAYQALAIAHKSCVLPHQRTSVTVQNFLYQTMKLQGFKLYPNKVDPSMNGSTAAQPLPPSDLYDLAKKAEKTTTSWCFESVDELAPLKVGDVLASHDDTLVIDSVSADPFGIEKEILKNPKKFKLNLNDIDVTNRDRKISDRAHRLCDEWTSDPKEYKIKVLSFIGKTDLFPTFGKAGTTWVTALTQKAVDQCYRRVTEEIIKATFPADSASVQAEFTSTWAPNPPPTADGVKVLQRSKDPLCQLTRSEVNFKSTDTPSAADVACVQCCQEDGK